MKRSSEIVSLTTEGDAHLNFVQKHLDIPITVLDPRRIFEEGTELTFEHDEVTGHTRVIYDGRDLSGTQAIWYRKTNRLSLDEIRSYPLTIDGEKTGFNEFSPYIHGSYNRATSDEFLQLALGPDRFWVSRPDAIKNIEGNKVMQSHLAHKFGFRSPPTVMTSSLEEADAFIRKHGRVVVKPVKMRGAVVDGEGYAFYTTELPLGEEMEWLNELQIRYAPVIIQKLLPGKTDLRVTVIGDKVFTCMVSAGDEFKDKVDIRHDFETSLHVPYSLTEEEDARIVALTRSAGLQFSTFDFALMPDGKLYFLDWNPNGQWAWIEEKTGMPMGRAFADLLNSRRSIVYNIAFGE